MRNQFSIAEQLLDWDKKDLPWHGIQSRITEQPLKHEMTSENNEEGSSMIEQSV